MTAYTVSAIVAALSIVFVPLILCSLLDRACALWQARAERHERV